VGAADLANLALVAQLRETPERYSTRSTWRGAADRDRRSCDLAFRASIRHSELVAERWFLKIDGIQGESTDASHKDEIDVSSWSWGVTHTGGTGAGGGAGKVAFQDFHFVSRISKASPALFLACATGTHHKSAALSGVRTAGKSKSGEFLKYKLSDVVVTSDQHSGDEDGEPIEQFSLKYAKVEVTFTPQTTAGKAGTPVRAGFDVKANKQF
jgi:type VI secretion system secreted protein Hcp